jgi:hypothetical protein
MNFDSKLNTDYMLDEDEERRKQSLLAMNSPVQEEVPEPELPVVEEDAVEHIEMPPMELHAPAPQKPDWRTYLNEKYKQQGLDDEKRASLEKRIEDAAPAGWRRGLYAAGGGNVNDLYADQNQARADLRDFDARRRGVVSEMDDERRFRQFQDESEAETRERDPNSPESKLAQDLAKEMGYKGDLSGLTAAKWKTFSPALQKKYEIEQRKQEKAEKAQEAAAAKAEKVDDERGTPYGLARTKEDAKDLKSAHISKKNFDNKLNEMIALRKKHDGGSVMNREDVARGKQLSKDLLLEYKNMAKLGVLSDSDANIINAIIPEDPLAFDFVPGQDPILHRLEKFKQDSDKDFTTRVTTRIKPGAQTAPAVEPDTKKSNKPKPKWAE